MSPSQKSRYTLTVNAFTLDDVKQVESELKANSNANEKLRLDACYGPNAEDGSYLAMFSSDSLANKGQVPFWSEKAYLKLFYGIRKRVPGVRLVLRGNTKNDAATPFTHIFDRVQTQKIS